MMLSHISNDKQIDVYLNKIPFMPNEEFGTLEVLHHKVDNKPENRRRLDKSPKLKQQLSRK